MAEGERRDVVLTVRVTEAEKLLMEAVAEEEGDTLSEWTRAVLLRALDRERRKS